MKPATVPYRPSNGTEGLDFQTRFCDRCIWDHRAHEGNLEHGCNILARTLALGVDDDGYPTEWIEDTPYTPGSARCTAFEECGCDR